METAISWNSAGNEAKKISANFTKHAIYSGIGLFSSDKDPKNERSVNFYTEYSRIYFFSKVFGR